MNKIKNLFPKIYDFENLFYAYKDGIKQKRDRPDVMAYTEKLEENLITLQNEFIWKTYKVGAYRKFFVYEPKRRLIMALDFKDRVAQHAIYRQLNPILDKQFIFDSYACRRGKGTHKAVKRLQYWFRQVERKPGKYYYLKLDISKYFYRIDHEILMDILRLKIADKDLLYIMEGIVNCEDTHFGLPMGGGYRGYSIYGPAGGSGASHRELDQPDVCKPIPGPVRPVLQAQITYTVLYPIHGRCDHYSQQQAAPGKSEK